MKLLKELKIMEYITPDKYVFTNSFLHIYKSNIRRNVPPVLAVNNAVNSYCPDILDSDLLNLKSVIASIMACSDHAFCRECIIEQCMAGDKLEEIQEFINNILKYNSWQK